MNERIYRELESGVWAMENPAKCPCRGGWLLSDYDTWHRCPLHGKGVPHPEGEDDAVIDMHAHSLQVLRETYAGYRDQARRMGFQGNFNQAVNPKGVALTPQGWVNAAEDLVDQLRP